MIFTLEALQADQGDCLLLTYGPKNTPSFIVIDGGPTGIYKSSLKPRLEALRAKFANQEKQLELALVMVSHIDDDHIHGIVDFLKALKTAQDDKAPLPYRVGELWHNSFEALLRRSNAAAFEEVAGASAAALEAVVPAGIDRESPGGAVVASVKQGNDARNYAKALTIPLNRLAGGDLVTAPAAGKKVLNLGQDLKFTVLGPHEAEMQKLEKEWRKAKTSGEAESEAFAADYLNRTAENLSSIVVLAEMPAGGGATKRALLTGDAGGDLILEGLKTAGLLTNGKIHVDLLKVQHHGSRHSVDQNFFECVTADSYVISGNGKHTNPAADTLAWLSAARKGEEYQAYLTNRKGVLGLTKTLDTFLASERKKQPKHHYTFRKDGELSIPVHLLEEFKA